MIPIKIITVGKQKSGPLKDLCLEYTKRLRPFARVEIIELKEEKFSSETDAARAMKKEAERLEHYLDQERTHTVLLTAEGSEMDSLTFAALVDEWSDHGKKEIRFFLGGPLGFDPTLKDKTNATLSLSRLTFPHDLARVVLLEQLYRACTIQRGKTYHY